MSELPEDAVDTIILQLTQLEIPQIRWEGYLRRLALELPGWSGLINWRQHHPHYQTANDAAPKLGRLSCHSTDFGQAVAESGLPGHLEV